LLAKYPSNRQDGRWDLYIRMIDGQAFLGVTKAHNHFDVTSQWHSFEQLWQHPSIEEDYDIEAIYVPDSLPEPQRKMGEVIRVVRDTSQSKFVKELYDYQCQICGLTIHVPKLKSQKYCEGHHVQPLGKLYKGPDHVSNIVALCPNHHSMMDLGVVAVHPDNLQIVYAFNNSSPEANTKLHVKAKHGLHSQYLSFHLNSTFR
jgi:predicted restriction endonuclease